MSDDPKPLDHPNRHDPASCSAPRAADLFEPPRRHDATNFLKPVSEPSARLDALAASVVDAAFEVHRTLGAGYLESVYQAAMCVELRRRAIPFEAQFRIDTFYKGELVGEHRFDLLIDGDLVVELKAVEALAPIHLAQVLSYLKAGCFELGLLINFNVPLLKNGIRRVIWTA